tara:strand:- start:50762 stop:51685 length:924 start_codon:yes stop_codon:yes gene_type:complete
MKFNSSKVSFGRHETFALRYSWLSKGFHALSNDPSIFESEDATIELGVGKNMVQAIRFWLRACKMMHPTKSEPTRLGHLILDEHTGFDPYLEDEATIWLIHWLLTTNPELATSFYWFFNKFHKPEFTSQELTTALADFVKGSVDEKRRPALTTIKNDSQLLHRMYTQSKGNSRMPLEDALDSPLAMLRLVSQSAGGRSYRSKPESRKELPIGIVGFAVCEILAERELKSIPIEELMYSRGDYPAPGATFRLSENDLVLKLEELTNYIPGSFEIRETAGIHQLYQLRELSASEFLSKHYADGLKGVAA